MPLETAVGGLALAEEYLRDMLAACARWQTMCKAPGNSAIARAHTFCDWHPKPDNGRATYSKDELVGLRPLAIVWTDENAGYTRTRVGTGCYAESGILNVQIEANVEPADADDPQQLMRKIKNDIGVLVSELDALAYEPGYIAANVIQARGPWRCERKAATQEGDHVLAFLSLAWGADA
jgi:hypothetical protein